MIDRKCDIVDIQYHAVLIVKKPWDISDNLSWHTSWENWFNWCTAKNNIFFNMLRNDCKQILNLSRADKEYFWI